MGGKTVVFMYPLSPTICYEYNSFYICENLKEIGFLWACITYESNIMICFIYIFMKKYMM
jgi:hypothetical protein